MNPSITYRFVLDLLDANNASFKGGEEALLVISRQRWEQLGSPSVLEAGLA